ncbi:MAG: hypothetical protein ACR2HT_06440 [Pyrinomonadaceae bacterium]
MYETDEFDELEIETVAAAHLFDNDNDCDERQIDEYGDYGVAASHQHHNAGCSSCLILISMGLLLAAATALLVLAL